MALNEKLACALHVALQYNMFAIDGTFTLPRGTLPEDYLASLVENGSMVEDAFDLQFRQQPDVCGRIPENQFQAFAAESDELFMATLKRAQSERCIRRLIVRCEQESAIRQSASPVGTFLSLTMALWVPISTWFTKPS